MLLRLGLLAIAGSFPLLVHSRELSATGGYNYQNSDQGNGTRTNLHGWFVGAQFDFNPMIAITGEVDNYYSSRRDGSIKQQNFVAGPQITFRNQEAKLRPFVYVQLGDQRASSGGTVIHALNMQCGGGFQLKLQDRMSLQLTPAEYNLAIPNGIPTHSYGVKVGITWTLWKGK
jgi:hypothetical protein